MRNSDWDSIFRAIDFDTRTEASTLAAIRAILQRLRDRKNEPLAANELIEQRYPGQTKVNDNLRRYGVLFALGVVENPMNRNVDRPLAIVRVIPRISRRTEAGQKHATTNA